MGLRGPKPRSPRTDYQQMEVYAWEDQFFSAKMSTAPERHFRGILRDICDSYDVPRPKVRAMPKGAEYSDTAAFCWAEAGALYFRRGYRSILILCHEMAHWILDHYGYPDIGHHGPRFMGIYLYLLAEAQVLPLAMSVPAAKAAGLEFRDPVSECAPGKLQRYLEAAA